MTDATPRWRAFAVGVGANLGDRSRQVAMAVRLLADDPSIRHLRVADGIVTDPVVPNGDAEAHPAYLNTAIIGETTRSPDMLLARLLAIETACGRRRRGTVDPRTLDLDLLVHEGFTVRRDGLEVPHPRLAGRRFVLDPLIGLLAGAAGVSGADQTVDPWPGGPASQDAIRRELAEAGVAESDLR